MEEEAIMKMFFIVYSRAADYDVVAKLKSAGVKGYTKMEDVSGEGTDSEPKLGTHCWPGENNVLYIAVQDEEVPCVCEVIREIRKYHPRAGVKGFILPMMEII
jgi:nitrogen regulatory protein PII